jgi:hypothetical protein
LVAKESSDTDGPHDRGVAVALVRVGAGGKTDAIVGESVSFPRSLEPASADSGHRVW